MRQRKNLPQEVERAIIGGDVAAVEAWLDAGNPIETRTAAAGTTLLMLACFNDQRWLVDMLLRRGAAVDAKNKHGATALMQ